MDLVEPGVGGNDIRPDSQSSTTLLLYGLGLFQLADDGGRVVAVPVQPVSEHTGLHPPDPLLLGQKGNGWLAAYGVFTDYRLGVRERQTVDMDCLRIERHD